MKTLADCVTALDCRVWAEQNAVVTDDFSNMALNIKPLHAAFERAHELGREQGWGEATNKAANDLSEYGDTASVHEMCAHIRALKMPTNEKTE